MKRSKRYLPRRRWSRWSAESPLLRIFRGNGLSTDLVRGGRAKKHIGLLFDVMRTTPTNILANADKFAEHAPYLDGVAIALSDIPVVDADGKTLTVNHASIMNGSQRWSREVLDHHVPVLKAIAAKKGLSESFLLFWITPLTQRRFRHNVRQPGDRRFIRS